MQLNPVNLLIAAQQARNAAPAPNTSATKGAAKAAAEFEPLEFSSAAQPPETAPKTKSESAFQRPGSQIDIRV